MFKCEHCAFNFVTSEELMEHMSMVKETKIKKKIILLGKLDSLRKNVSEQKMKVSISIFDFKKIEGKASQSCRCKGFCRINHTKMNFIKSRSDELLFKLKDLYGEEFKTEENVKPADSGCIRKRYPCKQCDKEFTKQGRLKKHLKTEHRAKREENGEV